MLELLYMNIIIKFIDESTDLNRISECSLASTIHARSFRNAGIKEVDYLIKENLDHLIERYGELGSLVRIDRLKKQACTRRLRAESGILKFDLGLLIDACNYLYDRIETYYMAFILHKMNIYFLKIKGGTFDRTKFLKSIQDEDIFFPMNSKDLDQLSIEAFMDETDPHKKIDLQSLDSALKMRNRDLRMLKQNLRKNFTSREICDYATILIDLLSIELTEEHSIIIRVICHSVDYLDKVPPNKRKPDPVKKMLIMPK